MKTTRIACIVFLVVTLYTTSYAQLPLRFARIENIPDQFVGGEILKAVYSRLNIPIELVDLLAKRALMESSSGVLDGEVHRNIHVQQQYPTLIMIRPATNYIEPSVFSKNIGSRSEDGIPSRILPSVLCGGSAHRKTAREA